jgi:hypothetical protein
MQRLCLTRAAPRQSARRVLRFRSRRPGRSRAAHMQLAPEAIPGHWRPRSRTRPIFRPNPRLPAAGHASGAAKGSKCPAAYGSLELMVGAQHQVHEEPTSSSRRIRRKSVLRRPALNLAGDTLSAELAQFMPMSVCMSATAHRSYIRRSMHSGFGLVEEYEFPLKPPRMWWATYHRLEELA